MKILQTLFLGLLVLGTNAQSGNSNEQSNVQQYGGSNSNKQSGIQQLNGRRSNDNSNSQSGIQQYGRRSNANTQSQIQQYGGDNSNSQSGIQQYGRRSNANTQSQIQQYGTGNSNEQKGIQQYGRRSDSNSQDQADTRRFGFWTLHTNGLNRPYKDGHPWGSWGRPPPRYPRPQHDKPSRKERDGQTEGDLQGQPRKLNGRRTLQSRVLCLDPTNCYRRTNPNTQEQTQQYGQQEMESGLKSEH